MFLLIRLAQALAYFFYLRLYHKHNSIKTVLWNTIKAHLIQHAASHRRHTHSFFSFSYCDTLPLKTWRLCPVIVANKSATPHLHKSFCSYLHLTVFTILSPIHLWDNKLRDNQHGFWKGKSCFTILPFLEILEL